METPKKKLAPLKHKKRPATPAIGKTTTPPKKVEAKPVEVPKPKAEPIKPETVVVSTTPTKPAKPLQPQIPLTDAQKTLASDLPADLLTPLPGETAVAFYGRFRLEMFKRGILLSGRKHDKLDRRMIRKGRLPDGSEFKAKYNATKVQWAGTLWIPTETQDGSDVAVFQSNAHAVGSQIAE